MTNRALNKIGKEWSWPKGAREIPSIDPAEATDVIGIAPDSPAAEVDRAVQAAKKAFSGWRATPAPERAKILLKLAQVLTTKKQDLGMLVTRECGKPLPEGLGDVQEAIDMAYLAAGEGRRLYGETAPSELPNKMCLTFREPIGVCGLITPWNFPVAVPSWKALHALICGNTVVLKPAEDTPFCAVEFMKALDEAGLPPGVMNVVHGTGKLTGAALANHPDVAMISFTGSTKTGRLVAEQCGRDGKRVSLECGGKNAQIVLADADLNLALEGALWGAFGTAGQRCTATSRLILHKDIHDEFLKRLVVQAQKLKLGPGLKEGTHVGPLINQKQMERVLNYIEIGKKEDAKLATGGKRAAGKACANGFFVEPTVFYGVTRQMRIFQEEIFGPVLSVIKVNSLEEAVQTLNDCAYGLSSSIYTRDVNRALAAMREIEAGIVYVNGPTIGAEVHMPFGGVKGTGNGHREAGKTGLDIFTEWKTVYMDYSGKLQRAQIDNAGEAA